VVVGVALGVEAGEEDLLGHAVGLVLHRLAALVLDHLALVLELLLGKGRKEPAHPVGLQEEGPVQVLGGDHLPVVGAVLGGGAVEAGAHLLQGAEEVAGAVEGSLEHHVLEKVGQSRPSRPFVLASHVVPEVHRRLRETAVLVDDDGEAVGETVFFKGDAKEAGQGHGGAPPRGTGPGRGVYQSSQSPTSFLAGPLERSGAGVSPAPRGLSPRSGGGKKRKKKP